MTSFLDGLNARVATRAGFRLLRWSVLALLLSSLAACVATGANGPEDPHLESQPQPQSRVPGFGEVAFRVVPAPGSGAASARYCALLAETEAQVSRGLMGRRDLAGYDGMVFRFSSDSTGSFYMRDVPIPLTVAWFDGGGRFISSADMAPCPDREGCPLYPAARPYRLALEVPAGGLARLGVGPGSVLEVGGACSG